MPSQQNQDRLQVVSEKNSRAKSVVIAQYAGTSVAEQVELRAAIKKAGGEVVVTKNTLIDLAVGKGKLSDSLHGMNAVIFAYEDPVSPIKALFDFNKKNGKLMIKQGYMDDKVMSAEEVEQLSKLPSKAELLTKLLMILQTPGTNLVRTLNAVPQKLVYAVDAIAKKPAA
jgi:large subunit ribosomal protein L10